MNKRYILLLVAFFVGVVIFAQTSFDLQLGSPFITNYTAANYLDAGKNWAIAKGGDGKMYFANNYGLIQFDGYNWVRVGQPINQSELRSFCVYEDKIFIGGTSEIGFFQNDKKGNLNYFLLNDLIPDKAFTFSDVRKIAAFKEKIFFLTDNGIMMYANDTIRILEKGIPFRAVTHGIDELIFASNVEGLYRYTSDSLFRFTPKQLLKNISVEFILAIQPGTYLIGTERKGVLTYKEGVLSSWNSINQNRFIRSHLTHALILDKQQLMFGSLHNGLIVTDYQGNILNLVSEEDGLLDHNILSIFKDDSGNIWTAVDGSVAHIELSSPFTILNKKNGLRGAVHCLLNTNNSLYVGTSRGLYKTKWDPKSSAAISFKFIPKTTGQCWQLYEHEGNVLLAHHNGIYQINGNTAQYIGGNGNWNFVAVPDRNDLLLSGDYTGISVLEKKGNTYQIRNKIKGFTQTAREIAFDNDQLWVPDGYKGIYKLKLDEGLTSFTASQLYDIKKGLPSKLYNMLLDLEEGIFFGTQNGVYQYNAENDFMELNPFFNNILGQETIIRELLKLPNGNYFSVKNYDRTDEIVLVEILEDGSYSILETPFQKLRGNLIPAFEAILAPNDKHILIGGKEGLIIYDATFKNNSTHNHNCLLTEVTLPLKDSVLFSGTKSTSYVYDQIIMLEENEPIHFGYTSNFFESIPYTSFSTYLEGYDDRWQDWSNAHERNFKNLPEGNYTFWIKSRNIYDVESATTSFFFKVDRQSSSISTFYIVGFILVGLLSTLIYYLFFRSKAHQFNEHLNQLRQDLSYKEGTIRQTEAEKALLEKEIAKINKKLSGSLLQNEINAGLIQKINQIAAQNHSPESLQKALTSFKEDLKELEIQINAHQSMETDDFLSRIKASYPNLTARELRLCSYLKLNVSSKEIAHYLGISIRGVESLRYRVRKKLGLTTGQDLAEFIIKL